MTKFVHKPTTMTAVEWDGKPGTVAKMLKLGINFRVTRLHTATGQRLVGYVLVNRQRDTQIVDPGHWVTKGPDGWPRILSPREMADWEPVTRSRPKPAPEPVAGLIADDPSAAKHNTATIQAAIDAVATADMTDDQYAAWYAQQCERLDL